MTYRSISIASIDIGERFRGFSRPHAEKLSVAFTDYGRTAPIIVRPHPTDPERFILVAGMHRIEGATAAGLAEIDAEVRDLTPEEARRVEIAENVFRFELSVLDRARSLAELAQLYEADNPKNPGARLSRGHGGHAFADRFSKEAQKATGLSERTIRRDVEVAKGLAPDAVALLRGTPLAESTSQLLRLSREAPKDQVRLAKLIAGGQAKTLKAARALAGMQDEPTPARRPEPPSQEVIYSQMTALWDQAGEAVRKRFAAYQKGRA